MRRIRIPSPAAARQAALLRTLLAASLLAAVCLVLVTQLQLQTAVAQTDDSTPLPLFALPNAANHRDRSSGSMALGSDGITIVAANMLSNTATIVVPVQERIVAEVAVGNDPRNVAFTPNGALALVTNRGDGTLSVIDVRSATVVNTIPLGAYPYGVVSDDDGRAYVTLQGEGAIAEVDLVNSVVTRRFRAPGMPSGLAIWGDFLYVTHFWTGEISLIYLPSGATVARVATGGSNSIAQSLTLDITRGIAYLPQTHNRPQNAALTYDGAQRPVVDVINLQDMRTLREARVSLDQSDRPVNMPFALALDRFQQRIYVVNAGSNALSVIDLDDGSLRGHIEVGTSPRGVLLNRDNTLVFVHNVFDATIMTLDTSELDVIDVLPISTATIPTEQFIGAQLFYGATDGRSSRAEWLTCANCHFDGMSDGRVWAGFPDGARNTPILFGLQESAPYNWSGSWDELADIEIKIRGLQAGGGLIEMPQPNAPLGDVHAGLSADLDALVAYLDALPTPPPALVSGADEVMARGAVVFEEMGCAGCHGAPVFSSLQMADVGTGGAFDTPSLRWLWMSAPYFHDGRAATLADVFALPGDHQLIGSVAAEDIEALIAYLLTLPQ
jgi:YVTN family beta-propeller protein